jgi:Cyclic phosphodiesterase-like protein
MTVGSFAGLSLWLQTTNQVQLKAIGDVMQDLRQHCPAGSTDERSPNAPDFEAHATLLAGLKEEDGSPDQIWSRVQEAVRAWAASRKSTAGKGAGVNCKLPEVTTRGFFFQCVLAALEDEPSLIDLNKTMRKTFKKESQPAYFPHVSLLYADIGEDGAREEIARLRKAGLWEVLQPSAEGQSRAILGTEGNGAKPITSVHFTKLSLWDTNGPVAAWKKLEEMDLP